MKAKIFGALSRMMTCGAFAALPFNAQAVTVDLLVTYDTYTHTYFSGQPATAIRSWVDQVNAMYKNSQMDIQLRLVGTMQHDVAKTSMVDVLHAVRQDTRVIQKREELGADYVAQLHQAGNCGVAYVAVYKAYSFAVAGPKCGPNTLAHELGHTMGLNHSRRQGDTTGVRYGYGLGHGVDGVFADIMAYPQSFGAPKVPKFSNPNIQCNGVPCGVADGLSTQAYAAKAVNNVRTEIAAFLPTRVPDSTLTAPTTTTPTTSTPTTTTPTTTTPTTGVLADGVYSVKVKHSNLCANVNSASLADGAVISQWSCHLASNQRWTLVNAGSGFYELKAKHSGKCMEVAYASKSNGYKLLQRTCAKADHQLWKLIKNSDGSYQLMAKHSSKVAEIPASSMVNGALIKQAGWLGGLNQSWILQRLE